MKTSIMKKVVVLGALSAVLISCMDNDHARDRFSTGQIETGTAEQLAISKLEFLVGHWEGPGTVFKSNGTQTNYIDYEHVRFDLDNSLLLINATGRDESGDTTYSLHTVIFYDAEAQQYIYTPFTREGAPSPFKCKIDETPKLVCYSEDKSYRLTFQRLENGQWNEYGELLKEEGVWEKNFETILNRL